MIPVPDDALVIAGRTGAGRILSSPRRRARLTHLVSIGGPYEREPAGYRNIPNRLRLVFEDATSQAEGGPSSEDVERLVHFARRLDFQKDKLLVHCQAGISRSSAAAIAVLAAVLGPGSERTAVAHVRESYPDARPNPRIVEIADEVLGMEGRLVEALR